ncbi:MAG: hypothetical protein ACD_75C01708G0002 [uncultured bacterium]|nr:MAG: hypothetical protein ACD_75C01708G0002 [uncultured bacterium]
MIGVPLVELDIIGKFLTEVFIEAPADADDFFDYLPIFGTDQAVEAEAHDIDEETDLLEHQDHPVQIDLCFPGWRVAVGIAEGFLGVQQVLLNCSGKDEGVLRNIADIGNGCLFGESREFMPVQLNVARGVVEHFADTLDQGALAPAGEADDCEMFAGRQGKGNAVQQPESFRGIVNKVPYFKAPGQPGGGRIDGIGQKLRRRIEAIHGAAVADRGILICLVKFYQLLPGVEKLLLSGEEGDHRAQFELALHGQVAAVDKDHKRAQADKIIIRRLDPETKERPAYSDPFQPVGQAIEFVPFLAVCPMHLDFVDAGDGFGNLA